MMNKESKLCIAKEDFIFNDLEEEKQEEIRKEAIEDLKKTNPAIENKRIEYMKEFLIKMKIREIVRERYVHQIEKPDIKTLRDKLYIKKMRDEVYGGGGGNDAA